MIIIKLLANSYYMIQSYTGNYSVWARPSQTETEEHSLG